MTSQGSQSQPSLSLKFECLARILNYNLRFCHQLQIWHSKLFKFIQGIQSGKPDINLNIIP